MQDLSAYQSLTKLLLDCILWRNLNGRAVACLLSQQLFASNRYLFSLYFSFMSVLSLEARLNTVILVVKLILIYLSMVVLKVFVYTCKVLAC